MSDETGKIDEPTEDGDPAEKLERIVEGMRRVGYQAGHEGQPDVLPEDLAADIAQVVPREWRMRFSKAWRDGWHEGSLKGARDAGAQAYAQTRDFWQIKPPEAPEPPDHVPAPWDRTVPQAEAWWLGWALAHEEEQPFVPPPGLFDEESERFFRDLAAPVLASSPSVMDPLDVSHAQPAHVGLVRLLARAYGPHYRELGLWAVPIEDYKERHNLDNGHLAEKLQVTLHKVVKLALCTLPRLDEALTRPNFGYWSRIAEYTGIVGSVLRDFLLEMAAEVEPDEGMGG